MEAYQSAKEEIKRSANIVELIEQYVQLKKAGQNYLGLCPFHSEKDPSFTVSPSKQMFHCFGCRKGGDIFEFWMEYHKVTFPQAMRDLAERYHITLPERELTPSQRRKKELKESLFEINGIAADYFYHILQKTERGLPGRAYLEKRSLDKSVIDEFRIGYAPADWDDLTRFMMKKKVDMDKAVQAGLIIPKKGKGYYDRFRGRVIFPIYTLRKQVAGFGGRVLDESLPKYLNTPETPVFHKGEMLYGLNLSYRAIRESGRAVIVEGYTDVLALKRHGFNEIVATLGTALTKEHIRKLKGYAREAVVVFDADAAGKGAAIRSLPLFQNEGLSSKVMVLPEGEDPDSFISRKGLDGFLDCLAKSVPIFEFYLDLKLSKVSEGIEGQVDLLKEMIPVLSDLHSESNRLLYVRKISEKAGIAESVILSELRNRRISDPGKEHERNLRKKISSARAKNLDDLHLLNLFVHFPHTVGRLMDCDCRLLLSDPIIMEIFDSIHETYKKEEEITPEAILDKLEAETVRERLREVMVSPPIYPVEAVEQALKEFEDKVSRIKFSESLLKSGSNLEEKNRILILKRNMQG